MVILLVAIGNGMLGYRYLLSPGRPMQHDRARIGRWRRSRLLITIALNVWGKGIVRASCALIGMIVGYGARCAARTGAA